MRDQVKNSFGIKAGEQLKTTLVVEAHFLNGGLNEIMRAKMEVRTFSYGDPKNRILNSRV